MGEKALVEEAQRLNELLKEAGHPPRAMVWVQDERGSWRLWIVPSKDITNANEFYSEVSTVLVNHEAEFPGLDVGDIDFRTADHPAIKGLSDLARVDTGGVAHFMFTTLNGFYLPNVVVLQMTL